MCRSGVCNGALSQVLPMHAAPECVSVWGRITAIMMTQPQPCKREKFCVGQMASPPPPLPPQEPAFSKQIVPNTARTTSLNLLICSCRAGQ